jgi:hypothetical protein
VTPVAHRILLVGGSHDGETRDTDRGAGRYLNLPAYSDSGRGWDHYEILRHVKHGWVAVDVDIPRHGQGAAVEATLARIKEQETLVAIPATELRTVLLCGGPADGREIRIPADMNAWTVMEARVGGPRTQVYDIVPNTYAESTYEWVGVPREQDRLTRAMTAKTTLASDRQKKAQALGAVASTLSQRAVTMPVTIVPKEKWATVEFQPPPTDPISHAAFRLASATGMTVRYAHRFLTELVQQIGVPAAPKAAVKGETAITINTTKPAKWRFIDTETGETWRWDVEAGTFKKVVYPHQQS